MQDSATNLVGNPASKFLFENDAVSVLLRSELDTSIQASDQESISDQDIEFFRQEFELEERKKALEEAKIKLKKTKKRKAKRKSKKEKKQRL